MSSFSLVRYVGNEIAKQFTVPAVPVKPDPLAPLTAQVAAAQAEVDTTKAALATAQAQISATATVAATLPVTLAQADQVHATMAAATAKEVTDRQTAVASEATARSAADGTLGTRSTALEGRATATETGLSTEAGLRVAGDTANGNRATALEGRATVLETGAAAEQTARLAVAGRVTTLETGAGTEAAARAAADTGLGNRVTTLEQTNLNFKVIQMKTAVVIPTVALLGFADVTVTWPVAFAGADYATLITLYSSTDAVLGSLTYFVKAQTATTVTIRVKALLAFTTGTATLTVMGVR